MSRLLRTHRSDVAEKGKKEGNLGIAGFPGVRGQAHPSGPIAEADVRVSHQQLPLSPPENQTQEARPGFLHCQREHCWASPGAESSRGHRNPGSMTYSLALLLSIKAEKRRREGRQ